MFKATAAYGRTYSCQADAMRDWEAGRDFKMVNGPYFSIRDLDRLCDDAQVDRILSCEEYVLEISFLSTTKEDYDKFYVNFKGVCVLAT